MLPSVLAKQLQRGIGDYMETTFPMTNDPFRGSVKKMLETKDSVYHEPFVSVRLPFRVAEQMPVCFEAIRPAYLPYVHQQTAFERLTGDQAHSTLIATGTGSGKTECFLYPILEYCYQHRGERGIKALIIYPMNALASDQAKRIADLIWNSPELRGNVTAGMYVGGYEKHPSRMMSDTTIITDHDTILNCPPDILMTNYKMLDYLLVRPKDAAIWQDNRPDTLKYIAVDELHTFDGAQGTDLACLLRRLKARLSTPSSHLCCIGTSATMGSSENGASILQYAEEIFGEPFERDAMITEDRLSPDEFFAGYDIIDFTIPSADQINRLNTLMEQGDEMVYLRAALYAWTNLTGVDIAAAAGRIILGQHLMRHSFMQAMITLMKGNYYQVEGIAEALSTRYPALKETGNAEAAVNGLLALISHSRTGSPENPRPFLHVQVQLWIRELRRLLAKVSGNEITYAIAHDLNARQSEQYLPVVNCRDCGATGWTTILSERGSATIANLEKFYNLYFKTDEKIVILYPHSHESYPLGMIAGRICPNCLQVKIGENSLSTCDNCGVGMVDVVLPNPLKTTASKEHKQFICPFCGSRRGLSLMGLRSATEISTELSQLFASRFNDDKKTLAFSDNVQDAAHRAGFFNARTWRFGFRCALQRYVQNGGAGLSLADFTKGFIQYWHEQMDDESFVSFFIAPNMTWRNAYEEMIKNRKLGDDDKAKKLIGDIEKRISYEIMLEYGLTSRIGRTLEKSACSCLEFPPDVISAVARVVQERVFNEIGAMRYTSGGRFEQMTAGYLKLMAWNGAFDDDAFSLFLKENGNTYLLSNERVNWMPGRQSGRNTPRFIRKLNGQSRKNLNFDAVSDSKYVDWIASCCDEMMMDRSAFVEIGQIILEELVRNGIVVVVPATGNDSVYALNKGRVLITDNVAMMKCDTCGITYAVAESNRNFWLDAPCVRAACSGTLKADAVSGLDYYGKLFSSGDIARINAREHTGLLDRNDRETLEIDFKREKGSVRLWDPNVLSCTPTLEMGIDIGDLSAVILCSMPPAQPQFLQRTGRAGRKDGNALTLAIAAAKPHDLYFYADPLDMMTGNVVPPKIFLKASAVLERQFSAYCMDSWVRSGVAEQSIPKTVSVVLGKLDSHLVDVFPFNFLRYVQNHLSHLLDAFFQLFAQSLDNTAKKELRIFAQGNGLKESPMHMKILEAFQTLKQQKDALLGSIRQLNAMVKELESKPKDSSYEEEIKELQAEQTALRNVVREINQKELFNFLSDEGLLPNYAFPESGIVLKAILYRKDEEPEEVKKSHKKSVYEYSRSASAAISEFAPDNSFYVGGRKLTINQVDLTSAQSAKWRLCPNCSYAQIEEAGKNAACCPRCGSPAWADAGQARNMLKVQMVYSYMDYRKSLISDESDDRSHVFYCKQMLVDVDEDHDISSAYEMNNEEFHFGYEFVRKATLREINFGESDIVGEKLTISGIEDVRKGFKICQYCGRIQPNNGKEVHTFYCKSRKISASSNDPFAECLFLYREFATEALRILIPATTMDASAVRTESFTAAFMLGMKEYFGNVDHLRATVSAVPIPDADYRKQYLVIYDSVPGGTGYLKQLMKEQGSLIDIFERALQKLEQCSCKEDPQKDGCYHCLYAYRQSQNIGNISRRTAIQLLKTILSGKANWKKMDGTLSNISVNSLFDSELERRFIEAIERMNSESRRVEVSKSLVNEKEGYTLKVNESTWEIEPQVLLDASQGVSVTCKPDFIIRPIGKSDKRPVAVFTDGFLYHKDKIADDTLKREAIRRSGKYRVWVLSWRDVQSVFQTQGDYYTLTLTPEKMPSGAKMYQPVIGSENASVLKPGKMSMFELLMRYLDMEEAERLFETQARAYSLSLLEPMKATNALAFLNWNDMVQKINSQTCFMEDTFVQPGTFFGTWTPRTADSHFHAYAGILVASMKTNKNASATVCALLDDRTDSRTDHYEQEWNGFWHFFNVMQFAKQFVSICNTGLDTHAYVPLLYKQTDIVTEDMFSTQKFTEGWGTTREMLFEEEAIEIANALQENGIAAPDEMGYELANESGAVIAEFEMIWLRRKIGYMTEEQRTNRHKAEAAGWKVFTAADEIDVTFKEG